MRCLAWLLLALCLAGCCSPLAVAQAGVRSVDQVRSSGSLRGTELDGDWGNWQQGRQQVRLKVDAALYRRFDHLLTAIGELDLRELRQWVEREVTRERGAAAAAEVLVAWDEHLLWLQGKPTPAQETASTPSPPSQPLPPARRSVSPPPHALLTPEPIADAGQLQALHAQRTEAFGAAAAERLRIEDAARWAWAQRLAQARAQLLAIGSSAPAREAYLARQFSGRDLLRARALFGLPP